MWYLLDLNALIGKSLTNRFELKKLIGQGGYGAVFEAVQTSMNRRCAVKVLSISIDDPKQIARFELEARVTCQLSHPNTIVVYEYGRDEELGVFFIAMEYLDGISLRDLSNTQSLTLDEALHILYQVAESLDDAHTYGLVHRDVKPHNVMIIQRGGDPLSVKVIDFGIAKTQEEGLDLTQTDTIIGTPEYMSTEQVLNRKLSGKTDQYALAVTAYFLLTGRTVFQRDTALQIAVAHAQETPKAISAISDRFISADKFDAILLKALSKDPKDRFDSCKEFVTELIDHRPELSNEKPHIRVKKPTDKLSTRSYEHAVARTQVAASADELPLVKTGTTSVPLVELTINPSESISGTANFQDTSSKKWIFFLAVGLVILGGLGALFYRMQNSSQLAEIPLSQAKIEVEKKLPNETFKPIENPRVEKIELPKKVEETKPEKSVENIENIADQALITKKETHRKSTDKNKIKREIDIVDALSDVKKTEVTKKKGKNSESTLIKNKKVKYGTAKVIGSPWGVVYVDGKRKSSIRFSAELPAGVHTFVLKQDGVTKVFKRKTIKASKTLVIRLRVNQ